MSKLASDTQKTISPFWFKAITGELVAQWKFGMTSRNGSPMAQFRRVFPDFPRNTEAAKRYILQMLENNPHLVAYTSVTLRNYLNIES